MELVDGSLSYEKEEILNIVKDCNVVVLMYDFQNTNSLNKLKFEILPILNLEHIYSIIIVGNKIDTFDLNTQKFVIEQDKAEIEKYQEDMTIMLKYFSISCKNYFNISNLFTEILTSLVNPTHIFYKNEDFNENFIKALTRIYRILDKDRKGVISKNDFIKIHEEIYKMKLDISHFQALSEFIKILNSYSGNQNEKPKENQTFSLDNGVTLENFITLNKASVQINESQVAWSVLRKYGYNDQFFIDEWYFKSKKLHKTNSDEFIFELTENAKILLTTLFNQYGKKKILKKPDGSQVSVNFISEEEWDLIFSTYPYFKKEYCFGNFFRNKEIFLEEFLQVWNSLFRINYIDTFRTFISLGFDMDFEKVCRRVKKYEINYFKPLKRKTIYTCFIAQKEENMVINIINFIF